MCQKRKFFFAERIIVIEKVAKELGDLRNVIFQDDQDHKQRMWLAFYRRQNACE
jgi:hypothetical protein